MTIEKSALLKAYDKLSKVIKDEEILLNVSYGVAIEASYGDLCFKKGRLLVESTGVLLRDSPIMIRIARIKELNGLKENLAQQAKDQEELINNLLKEFYDRQ